MQLIYPGKSNTIAIKLFANDVELKSISINEKIPISFSFIRIAVSFFIITFIYCIKNLEIFKIPFSRKNFKQESILLIILGIFLCLNCFINDYSRENEKYDFYSLDFVEAISTGNISLKKLPSKKLLELDNPYDPIQRTEEGIVRGQDYIWDSALYNGRFYVYFGILPVLILFLPYFLFTGNYLISAVGVLIFSILSAIAIKELIEIVFSKFFKETHFKYVVFAMLIMLFGSQILVLNGIPRFYEVPIAAGLFFTILGIDLVLSAIYCEKINYAKIFFGSTCLALAVACRPTDLLASLIIVPILLKLFKCNIKNRKNIIKNILSIVVPYIIVGCLLMYYNYIRFGSVFEFGAKYQLTINDMMHLSNRFATIFMGLVCNLFSIPVVYPNFPFISNHNNLITFNGFYYIENMIGGLFILVPVCFFIFKLPIVLKKSKNRELVNFILTLLIVGFIICILSITMAGSMQRYIVDYGWMIILAGICTFIELQNIYKTNEAKHILKKIFTFITIWVVCINLCSGIVSEKSFLKDNSPEVYYKMKYLVDFWE